MGDLYLISVGAGALALSHRPKLNDLPLLRAAGVTHVVTLLAESEGARQIGDAAIHEGLVWLWVPLVGANIPDATRAEEFRRVFGELRELLMAGGKLFIHCSAGIHRTGMFGYALLRQLGLSGEDAHVKLAELRQVTATGVGSHRLAWGDALLRPPRTSDA